MCERRKRRPQAAEGNVTRATINGRSRWLLATLSSMLMLLLTTDSCQAFQRILPQQQRSTGVLRTPPLPTPSTSTIPTTTTTTTGRGEMKYSEELSGSAAVMSSTTSLSMFMGSEGGILGVGTPELATILLVGYFVLGPSDLYKIVKEVGKFIQNARTLSTDLTTSFESNMESQLQLEELRKAQRELNDAFSFRRTINVDETADAFSTTSGTYETEDAAAPAATTNATATSSTEGSGAPKKIRRRVRKKKQPEQEQAAAGGAVPDLEMPAPATPATATATTDSSSSMSEEEAALIEEEFEKYVSMGRKSDSDWYTDDDKGDKSKTETTAATGTKQSPEEAAAAQTRFQQQLSGKWNEQVLENDTSLQPLAAVMNKIALLEKEKIAATKRLEEEFAKRTELENEYYAQQRELLEDAAQQVQAAAFGVDPIPASSSSKAKQKSK